MVPDPDVPRRADAAGPGRGRICLGLQSQLFAPVRSRPGRAEVIALAVEAAHALQVLGLRRGFDAFGQHVQTQRMCQRQDGADDHRAAM